MTVRLKRKATMEEHRWKVLHRCINPYFITMYYNNVKFFLHKEANYLSKEEAILFRKMKKRGSPWFVFKGDNKIEFRTESNIFFKWFETEEEACKFIFLKNNGEGWEEDV